MAALRQKMWGVSSWTSVDPARGGTCGRRNVALRSSGSIAGFRERYHKLFDEVFTWFVWTLSHLSVNVRVGALTASFLSGMGSTDPIPVARSGDRIPGSVVTFRPAVLHEA
ncbi:hypothetical protein Scani_08550 [Streptomyces caniferus]|uniref:Uncharacterized protein n=1 Tax=Streptomyces caniferus TaxID=285557 RepID=A0A640S0W3_9ACTN|nr:hypothetical protein Scani_08550 [Streptomyces caniferus]